MQLYFVRHGQSTNNLLWDQTRSDKGRSDDPPLTEAGHAQAKAVGQFLSRPLASERGLARDAWNVHGFGVTHVYSSLMLRAVQTGTAVARAIGVPLVALEPLHETGGIYLHDEETGSIVARPGKNRAFFSTEFPDCVLPDCVSEQGWWNRTQEPPEECLPRARRALDELWSRHHGREDRVVVVTHGAFYNYLLAAILNLHPEQVQQYWFVMHNCAVTRVDFIESRVVVPYTNRVDFLPSELIT